MKMMKILWGYEGCVNNMDKLRNESPAIAV